MAGPRVKYQKQEKPVLQQVVEGKKGNLNQILLIGSIALSMFLTTGGALYYVYQSHLAEQERLKAEAAERKRLAEREPEEFRFEPIRVNIKESKSGFRFFEVKITVKVLPGIPERELMAKMPLIREELNFQLGEKTEADLTQPNAQAVLKKEVLDTINLLLSKSQIKDIYFSNYLLER